MLDADPWKLWDLESRGSWVQPEQEDDEDERDQFCAIDHIIFALKSLFKMRRILVYVTYL